MLVAYSIYDISVLLPPGFLIQASVQDVCNDKQA
jgi:hypothetical protein